MIEIMLVDDHQLVRDGVRSHLEKTNKYKITAEASNGEGVLEELKTKSFDLIIMDINMEGMGGINCSKEIQKLYPGTKILALTMLSESQYIKQMLAAGAVGYLLKNCSQKELTHAIDQIISQGNYYSPEVTKTIINTIRGKRTKPSRLIKIPLTDREKEVLHLILKEYTNKEIADTLFISSRTVDAHKRNLLEKTGSKNIAGLVLYAINHELFEDF